MYLHRDQDMLPGFPKQLPSDGASSPLLVDLDGDNRNELVFGDLGRLRARDAPRRHRAAGLAEALATRCRCTPAGDAFTSGEVDAGASHAAILASAAATDLDHDGLPEVVVADMGGKVYVWNADGSLRFKREAEIDYSGKPLQPFENVRRGHRYRTQHGFIGSPVLADLDGNGGDLEVIAANMDRHVYAWHADGTPVDGFPVLVIDRSKIDAIDPQTHAPTFAPRPARTSTRARSSTRPRWATSTGDGKPEIVVGTNEEYAADADGGINAGIAQHGVARRCSRRPASSTSATAACSRSSPRASPAARPSAARARTCPAGRRRSA